MKVNKIVSPSQQEKETLWHETISGSQMWKLFNDTEYWNLISEKKELIKKPEFSKFTIDAINRGIEREPLIIEKINKELELNLKTPDYIYHIPELNISGTFDAVDDENKVLYEIKSSKSKITYDHAVFQVKLYILISQLVMNEKKLNYKEWKYYIAMENPTTLKISYFPIELSDDERTTYIDKIKQFFKDLENAKYYENKDKELLSILNLQNRKKELQDEIKMVEHNLDTKIKAFNKGVGYTDYYYFVNYDIKKVTVIPPKPETLRKYEKKVFKIYPQT